MEDLLETCPITPLGVSPCRERYYYRLTDGDIVTLRLHQHAKLNIIAMFNIKTDWLEEHFPRWSKPRGELVNGTWQITEEARIIDFDQTKAAEWLVAQCAAKGRVDVRAIERAHGE